MMEMLEDDLLFREFGEFCRDENCIENILFYRDYWKYKKLFQRHDKPSTNNTDVLKSRKLSMDSVSISKSEKNKKERRISSTSSKMSKRETSTNIIDLDVIDKEAQKFCDNFIGNNAIYEINIQHFIVKTINDTFKILRMDQEQTIEEKINGYYTAFDRAYKEVTNNIYLNSYSNYINQKNKGNNDKQVNTKNEVNSNMC
ncbi:hypothetical protein BCR32DRAFT_326305 [Anaeromyces robustus]|uniref:RGS domain-containing protein n=1 Tax=Anaeromyces robustus TaxID=1754192 RepID=A0A1Y1XD14_9FUNG|nr:hypothetical protein BCR32DRAFT_326305 [Anaeromyces robustus]|eukprot:ORX83629.1 hypothetical protein BCR32DRAFT_326305 [Anaeromyces robustus]